MRYQTNYKQLTHDEIQHFAPSVFAEAPASTTSDKYFFVPTIEVVKKIEGQGFSVVSASQSRSKTAEGRDFVKHMLRFRRTEHIAKQILNAKDSVTELILVNSHNGLCSFQLNLGLWRQVCSNGLIASDTLAKESVKHIGYKHEDILEAQYRVLDQEQQLIEKVDEWREVNLDQAERMLLANAALTLRYDAEATKPKPEQLLQPRRWADQNTDLWTTFNVIQENMIKGGLRTVARQENGRIRRNSTREVASVNENKKLNQALWELAEGMKNLKVKTA